MQRSRTPANPAGRRPVRLLSEGSAAFLAREDKFQMHESAIVSAGDDGAHAGWLGCTGAPRTFLSAAPYRRSQANTDLSLECETGRVPADGRYHLLRGDQVVSSHRSLKAATAAYLNL